MSNYWKSIYGIEGRHHNTFHLTNPINGIEAIKSIFTDGKCDEMNFILFSTSGVHGDYTLIEEVELEDYITFLIIHPRTVTLRYGNAKIDSEQDIDFLKKLRESSKETVAKIGFPEIQEIR